MFERQKKLIQALRDDLEAELPESSFRSELVGDFNQCLRTLDRWRDHDDAVKNDKIRQENEAANHSRAQKETAENLAEDERKKEEREARAADKCL